MLLLTAFTSRRNRGREARCRRVPGHSQARSLQFAPVPQTGLPKAPAAPVLRCHDETRVEEPTRVHALVHPAPKPVVIPQLCHLVVARARPRRPSVQSHGVQRLSLEVQEGGLVLPMCIAGVRVVYAVPFERGHEQLSLS